METTSMNKKICDDFRWTSIILRLTHTTWVCRLYSSSSLTRKYFCVPAVHRTRSMLEWKLACALTIMIIPIYNITQPHRSVYSAKSEQWRENDRFSLFLSFVRFALFIQFVRSLLLVLLLNRGKRENIVICSYWTKLCNFILFALFQLFILPQLIPPTLSLSLALLICVSRSLLFLSCLVLSFAGDEMLII